MWSNVAVNIRLGVLDHAAGVACLRLSLTMFDVPMVYLWEVDPIQFSSPCAYNQMHRLLYKRSERPRLRKGRD